MVGFGQQTGQQTTDGSRRMFYLTKLPGSRSRLFPPWCSSAPVIHLHPCCLFLKIGINSRGYSRCESVSMCSAKFEAVNLPAPLAELATVEPTLPFF